MSPPGLLISPKRTIVPTAIFAPALAFRVVAASALPCLRLLDRPRAVPRRGESNQNNRDSVLLCWMTLPARLPSASSSYAILLIHTLHHLVSIHCSASMNPFWSSLEALRDLDFTCQGWRH
ncbi:hypothetical protein OPV22_018405 [Ensete ventricosum]|uniref:Uncharacterized protein n=1 Tax=Ensete ventricosum TaxID=4639 RepID=A0AAV8PG88_ENSVE|nr:hypothetical protein OPV22_018405 [Ensete ventricosum]